MKNLIMKFRAAMAVVVLAGVFCSQPVFAQIDAQSITLDGKIYSMNSSNSSISSGSDALLIPAENTQFVNTSLSTVQNKNVMSDLIASNMISSTAGLAPQNVNVKKAEPSPTLVMTQKNLGNYTNVTTGDINIHSLGDIVFDNVIIDTPGSVNITSPGIVVIPKDTQIHAAGDINYNYIPTFSDNHPAAGASIGSTVSMTSSYVITDVQTIDISASGSTVSGASVASTSTVVHGNNNLVALDQSLLTKDGAAEKAKDAMANYRDMKVKEALRMQQEEELSKLLKTLRRKK